MAYIKWNKPYKFFIKQIFCIIIGFVAMFITSFLIDCKFYKKNIKFIYLLSLILVICVLFIGVSQSGSKRWLNMIFFTIQPSEFAKISVVLIMSNFISKGKAILKSKKTFTVLMIEVFLILIPIIMEPDLGTPILILITCFAMMFYVGVNKRKMLLVSIFVILLIMEETIRKPYRLIRFKNFFLSFININLSSYQIKQSINAVGSGGFFGKGLGKSEMKFMYIPESHTDFIFSVIGEELGFIGVNLVLLFFVYFFLKGIKISKSTPDIFLKYLCLGITFIIVFQAIINISVTIGILPTKGLTLPFISFGGTSIVTNMMITGILINLSQYTKK
jgi:cell division protein FtsW